MGPGIAPRLASFSFSIASVDPLPHQLEAVYDYTLRVPGIRILLADAPGAGKAWWNVSYSIQNCCRATCADWAALSSQAFAPDRKVTSNNSQTQKL